MNRFKNSRLLIVLAATMLCAGFTGCGPKFGEKLEIEGTEIYYKDGATKADADKLAKLLKEDGFIDGKKKSVQLLRPKDVWQFRMAVAKGSQKDEKVQESVKRLLLEISSALNGEKVELHLCNAELESVTVVNGLRGKKYVYDQTAIYYQGITLDQAKSIPAILFASGFPSDPRVAFHISQPQTTVKIKMAIESNPANARQMKVAATSVVQAASKKVFDGNVVEFEFCDPFFKTMSIISSKQPAGGLMNNGGVSNSGGGILDGLK